MNKEKQSYKFLLLEENPDYFTIIQELLFEKFTHPLVIRAKFEKVTDFLINKNNPFDAIILDLSLTIKRGKEIITDLLKIAGNCPIIILANTRDAKYCETYINQGVADYLFKEEITSTLLLKSILYAIKSNIQNQKIIQSEIELKTTQKAAKVGTWQTSLYDFSSIWSDEIYRILGEEKKESKVSHQHLLRYIYPTDLHVFKDAFTKSLSSKHLNVIHHRIKDNSGQIKFVEQRWKIVRDEESQPIYAVGTFNDVSEKKRFQERALKIEAYNKDILKNISSNIAIINSKGDIIASNEAWNRYSIENGEPIIEKTGNGSNYFKVCQDAWNSGDVSALKVLEGIKKVVNGKIPEFVHEYPCHSPEKKQWFAMKALKVSNTDKNVLIIHQDITPKKIVEFENEKIAFDLTQRNKNIEQFSYIVSHNLRGPLANILAMSELLKYDNVNPSDMLPILKGMSNAAFKMDDVLKDLNAILHADNPSSETLEEVYFQEITDIISNSFKNIIENQNIQIQTNFKEVESIFSLKSYIHSIFYNLIYNSIQFQHKNVTHKLEIQSKKTENGIQIKFKDNGTGINLQKNKERLFGFNKGLDNISEDKRIGLYIVKSQVEALKGNISVKSTVAKGTVFTIEFKIPLL